MVEVFISFVVGLVLGAIIAAVLVFRYLDRSLQRMGIDIAADFEPPHARPIACGFESEL
jgi:hypothetical protein